MNEPTLADPRGHLSPEDLVATTPISRWDLVSLMRHCELAISACGSVALAAGQIETIVRDMSDRVTRLGLPEPFEARQILAETGAVYRAQHAAISHVADAEAILADVSGIAPGTVAQDLKAPDLADTSRAAMTATREWLTEIGYAVREGEEDRLPKLALRASRLLADWARAYAAEGGAR